MATLQRPRHEGHVPNLGAFMKNNPPTFTGEDRAEGLVDREDTWIADMDKIWEAFECPNDKKTLFAAQKLSGASRTWWENLKFSQTSDEPIM